LCRESDTDGESDGDEGGAAKKEAKGSVGHKGKKPAAKKGRKPAAASEPRTATQVTAALAKAFLIESVPELQVRFCRCRFSPTGR
jgi:hypothetical protein